MEILLVGGEVRDRGKPRKGEDDDDIEYEKDRK